MLGNMRRKAQVDGVHYDEARDYAEAAVCSADDADTQRDNAGSALADY
jgi:hypothetical protein